MRFPCFWDDFHVGGFVLFCFFFQGGKHIWDRYSRVTCLARTAAQKAFVRSMVGTSGDSNDKWSLYRVSRSLLNRPPAGLLFCSAKRSRSSNHVFDPMSCMRRNLEAYVEDEKEFP